MAHPVTVASLVGAFLLELVFAIGGAILPASDGTYGAPLPFGQSPGIVGGMIRLGARPDFWPIPFAVDVLITAGIFWTSERVLGRGSGLAAAIGGLVGAAVLAWTYMYGEAVPIGFPFVVAADRSASADQLAAYANSLVFAVSIALAWTALRVLWPRRRARAGPRPSTDRPGAQEPFG